MRRTILTLVIVSFHFAGYCTRLAYGAAPSAAAGGQKMPGTILQTSKNQGSG